MTLVEELLKSDAKKADEKEVTTYKSKKLAKILGKKEPVEIKIQEMSARRINDILNYQLDKRGNMQFEKSYDANLMVCVESIIDPDIKNKDLQGHFNCKNAKDLCEKIFGAEASDIADKVMVLSGYNPEGDKEEIKN